AASIAVRTRARARRLTRPGPASATQSSAAGCDLRSEAETCRADLRRSRVRRARGRRRAAARRLSGTGAGSTKRGRTPSRSLHDYGLLSFDLALADACRECKRIVEVDAGGILFGARVVADDFLQ